MLEMSPITGQVWQKSKKKGIKGLGTPWHFIKVHPYSSPWPPHSWALPWHPWLCGTSKDHQWTTSPEQLSQLANCQKTPDRTRGPRRWGHVEKSLRRGSWSSAQGKERLQKPNLAGFQLDPLVQHLSEATSLSQKITTFTGPKCFNFSSRLCPTYHQEKHSGLQP